MRIIAGRWRGHRLKNLKGQRVRPTADRIREAWFSILSPQLPGARILDLFSGSGAIGLEALSRGAAHVVFVERARSALGALRANIQLLGAAEECTVVAGDALSFVRRLEVGAFDLVLADPPYGRGIAGELLVVFSEKRFAKEFWVEHRSDETLPDLPGLSHRKYGDTTLTRSTGNP